MRPLKRAGVSLAIRQMLSGSGSADGLVLDGLVEIVKASRTATSPRGWGCHWVP
jgi:hypothetical protein